MILVHMLTRDIYFFFFKGFRGSCCLAAALGVDVARCPSLSPPPSYPCLLDQMFEVAFPLQADDGVVVYQVEGGEEEEGQPGQREAWQRSMLIRLRCQ